MILILIQYNPLSILSPCHSSIHSIFTSYHSFFYIHRSHSLRMNIWYWIESRIRFHRLLLILTYDYYSIHTNRMICFCDSFSWIILLSIIPLGVSNHSVTSYDQSSFLLSYSHQQYKQENHNNTGETRVIEERTIFSLHFWHQWWLMIVPVDELNRIRMKIREKETELEKVICEKEKMWYYVKKKYQLNW